MLIWLIFSVGLVSLSLSSWALFKSWRKFSLPEKRTLELLEDHREWTKSQIRTLVSEWEDVFEKMSRLSGRIESRNQRSKPKLSLPPAIQPPAEVLSEDDLILGINRSIAGGGAA